MNDTTEVNWVKNGYRKNPVLAQVGEKLSDDEFNAILTQAFIRVNGSGKNLGEIFAEITEAWIADKSK